MRVMTEYEVELTFTTTIDAPRLTVATQGARKHAQAMNNDAANSHVELDSIDVEAMEEQ